MPAKQSGEFDWFLLLIIAACVALLAFCVAGFIVDAACAKDPDCRLVLRVSEWKCAESQLRGKVPQCIRYERVR